MATSLEVQTKFPVGCRVRTTAPENMRRNQTERYGTIRGYTVQSSYDGYVRVTWEGWKIASTTLVDSRTLTRVDGATMKGSRNEKLIADEMLLAVASDLLAAAKLTIKRLDAFGVGDMIATSDYYELIMAVRKAEGR